MRGRGERKQENLNLEQDLTQQMNLEGYLNLIMNPLTALIKLIILTLGVTKKYLAGKF